MKGAKQEKAKESTRSGDFRSAEQPWSAGSRRAFNSNSFGFSSPPTLRFVVGIEGGEGDGEEKKTAEGERRRPGL
jgi:hypothetical protein